jgi:hypothetical protein
MISVDELVKEDGKEGVDWGLARFANTWLFRPNNTCLVNHMEDTIRMAIRKEERNVDKQRAEITKNYAMFTKLVQKNASAHDIEHIALIITEREIGLRRTLTILRNFITAQQELQETKSRKTEQEIMTGLSTVYTNFMKRAKKDKTQSKTIRYEISRDAIADMHEMYHDAWRSGPEFERGEADTKTLVCKMIEARGLELPTAYIPSEQSSEKIKGKGKGKEKEKGKGDEEHKVDFELQALEERYNRLHDQ